MGKTLAWACSIKEQIWLRIRNKCKAKNTENDYSLHGHGNRTTSRIRIKSTTPLGPKGYQRTTKTIRKRFFPARYKSTKAWTHPE